MEEQKRKSEDHKRRISEVFKKAEPLKVRIYASSVQFGAGVALKAWFLTAQASRNEGN